MSTPIKFGYIGPELPTDYNRLSSRMRAIIRVEYAQRQKGFCHYCNAPLDSLPSPEVRAKKVDWRYFPPGFTRSPLHLHHDHKTGMTIGVVHALCNAVLWQYHGE